MERSSSRASLARLVAESPDALVEQLRGARPASRC
jgi:hypothetical protein